MSIRPEQTNDIDAIWQLTKAAFGLAQTSGQTEADLIDALRKAGALTISLVAIQAGQLVGHVAVSSVTINGEREGWYGLGPVSVQPTHQNQGIGTKLMREGLKGLVKSGANGCVVVGEPVYYHRFGFANDGKLHDEGVPPDYLM